MVLFPDFNKSARLPEGEEAAIEFTPERAGEYGFQCGMGMLRGKLRQLSRQPTAPQGTADPLEIAWRRLAAGEITIAEFDEIRTRLQSGLK